MKHTLTNKHHNSTFAHFGLVWAGRTPTPLAISIAVSLVVLIAEPGANAATQVWNNSTTAWETSSAWTPATRPTATDIASFDPTVVSSSGAVLNPTINSAGDVAASLSLANNFLGGNYSATGTGTLTLGGAVTVRGFGTQTISGPILAGVAAGNLTFNVGTDAGLTLAGATTATTNSAAVNVNGGTFTVNNSTNNTAKLNASNTVTVNGSGAFSLIGNSAGTTLNLGNLSAGSNTIGGFNTFMITPNGAATTINFANSASGFTTRPGTRGLYQFAATSGNLGDAAGARVTFAGTPFLGANGLLSNTSGGGTFGYATVKDAGGVDFGTWNVTNGVVRATSTQIGTTSANLQTYGASDRVQFNPVASSTTTATAAITNGSLRITPAGSGAVLGMSTWALATNALMLDGSNDFSITGTGLLGGTGTRYIYVNSASATLSTSIGVANGSNPTSFAGPGFVDLTGTVSQNTLTTTNRFVIAGGVVRGNNTQMGFTSSGAGIISLTGGVLEIKNGTNGTGASADFTRSLGSAAGNVTFGGATSNEIGSGGFSAFGAAASVNIGGAATPTALTWNASDFVGDGYALKFGSTKSNAFLTFLNPIALDGGSAGTYAAREFNVTAGAGGDRTVLSGLVSGSTSTDLLKTGTGTLQLATGNNYGGRTIIEGGLISSSGESAFGTNPGALVANQIVINGGGIQASTGNINFSSNRGITLGTGGGTFDTNGNSISVDTTNPITGPGSFTKNGIGTMDLRAANTFSGPVAVNAGKLLVTGSLTNSSAVVTVNSGGSLGGSGSIAGSVTAVSGGTVAPGSSPGTLTVGSGFSLNSGAHLVLEAAGTTGGTYDQILLTSGTATLGGDVQVSLFGSYSGNVGDKFYVIINNGGNPVSGVFSNDNGGVLSFAGGLTFSVNYADTAPGGNGLNSNDVSLTLSAVPEPSSAVSLIASIGMLLGFRRSRRRQS